MLHVLKFYLVTVITRCAASEEIVMISLASQNT